MSRFLPSEAVGVVSENFQQSVEKFIESDTSGAFKTEGSKGGTVTGSGGVSSQGTQDEVKKKIKKLKKHLQNPDLSSRNRAKYEANISKCEKRLSEIEEQSTKIQVLKVSMIGAHT